MTEPRRLSAERIAEIKARCAAATAAPWKWSVRNAKQEDLPALISPDGEVMNLGNRTQYYPTEGAEPSDADANFIAHSRTDLPDALHDLDVADGERDEAKKDTAYWKGLYDEVRSLLTTAQATIAQQGATIAAMRDGIMELEHAGPCEYYTNNRLEDCQCGIRELIDEAAQLAADHDAAVRAPLEAQIAALREENSRMKALLSVKK